MSFHNPNNCANYGGPESCEPCRCSEVIDCGHCCEPIAPGTKRISWYFFGQLFVYFHPDCANDFLLAFGRDVYEANYAKRYGDEVHRSMVRRQRPLVYAATTRKGADHAA